MVLITLGFGLSANAQTFAKPLKDVPFSVSVNSVATNGKAEVSIAYLPGSTLLPADFHATQVFWSFPDIVPSCLDLPTPACAELSPAERTKPTVVTLTKQGQQLIWKFPPGRYTVLAIVQDTTHGTISARNYKIFFQVNQPVEWIEDARAR